MNKIIIIGRVTKDIELKNVGEHKVVKFNVAVNRDFKNKQGEYDADFISCVAWNKTAELIGNYVKKGHRIALEGRIETGSYDNEKGDKVYTTDMKVEKIEFLESKNETQEAPKAVVKDIYAEEPNPFHEFGNTLDVEDEDLPF